MNNLKVLPILLFFSLFLCSCSDDEANDKGSYANLNMEVKFNNFRIVESIDGEVTDEITTDVKNFPSIVYIVHDADRGNFLYYKVIDTETLDLVVAESSTSMIIPSELPFGNYHISLVAAYKSEMKGELLDAISQDYSKAVCQIPNNHIFYATTEVDCTPPHEVHPELFEGCLEVDKQVELKKITGIFSFLLPKGDKGIPQKANFSIAAEATNIPNAFYLKNGQALSNSDMSAMGLSKATHKFEVRDRFEHQKLATYYLLSNYYLEDTIEERGEFSIVYKEDEESNVITNQTHTKMRECRIEDEYNGASHVYFWSLYSNTAPEQVEPTTRVGR